jgi:hypothetical protein
MTELARWGMRLLGEQGDEVFQIHWLTLSLQAMFQPKRALGVSLTVEFRIGADALHARIAEEALHTFPGRADDPDVVLTFADAATLVETGRDPVASISAISAGRLQVRGRPGAVEIVRELFGLTGHRDQAQTG